MRSDKKLKLERFLPLLKEETNVSVRMAITKEENLWAMQALVLTVAPDTLTPAWTCYDYGHIVFFAKQLSGAQLVGWIQSSGGEVDDYHFSVPELNDQVRGER